MSINNPFIKAAFDGNLELVKKLYQETPNIDVDMVDEADENRRTALLWAVCNGHKEVVKFLLSKKADIEAKDSKSMRAVHLAIINKKPEVLQELMLHGPDLEAKSEFERTPLHLAAVEGFLDGAKILIENHASLESCQFDGSTPLHCAASCGKLSIVILLLEKGAKIDAKTTAGENKGSMPIHLAACQGYYQVVKHFVSKNNSLIDAQNDAKQTPLHLAIKESRTQVAKILIEELNANVNLCDQDGNNAFLHAAKQGNKEIISILMARRADYISNKVGKTPLQFVKNTQITAFITEKLLDTYVDYGDARREYVCPITQLVMTDPVIAKDGYTYEREAITKWLNDNERTSPFTRQPIDVNALIPNRALHDLIDAYKKKLVEDYDKRQHGAMPTSNPTFVNNQSTLFGVNNNFQKTHVEMMQKFSKDLQVEYSAVYTGSAVEQTLSGMTGVYPNQSDALYRRNSNGTTYFHLNFKDENEFKTFTQHYEQQFQNFILSKKKLTDTRFEITVNTQILYEQVSQRLGLFRKNSHEDLMKKFSTDLGVDYDNVLVGDDVENSIVKMAGIDNIQSDVKYRRNEDYSTRFSLKLNDKEAQTFVDFYNQKFPGLILSGPKKNGEHVEFDMDTNILQTKVSPELKNYCPHQQPHI